MDTSFNVVSKEVTPNDPILDSIEKTYNASFPVFERRDFSLLRELMQKESNFSMYALLKDDQYVGFITVWYLDHFYYIEHFAIDESARNGGIGAIAMKSLLAILDGPVVLEVELPEDELSRRRIGFYERLGFVLDSRHPYKQPPYCEGHPWLDLHLMTYGDINLQESFEDVKTKIYTYVYGQ